MDILVCRLMELADAVTLPVLQRYTEEDTVLRQLMKDIGKGVINKDVEKAGYCQCFQKLSVQNKIDMRGDRIAIPQKEGRIRMLQQLRGST